MEELRQWLTAKGLVGSAPDEDSELYRRAVSIERYLSRAGIPADQARDLLVAILTGKSGYPAGLEDRLDAVAVPVSEHRVLTVLCCEVVAAAPLAGWLGPGDLEDDMAQIRDVVVQTVNAFGGVVGSTVGERIFAYYGYPLAHEDDAFRAICAALAVIERLKAAADGPTSHLAMRIGIATGTVVAGAVAGGVFTEHGAVVGETPSLAAHLAESVERDTIIVGEQTRLLTGSRFVFAELPAQNVVGADGPVRCWQVVRRHVVQSRFRASRHDRDVALIGRETELAFLDYCWQSARDGRGRVALLCGEAGVGKSRLVEDAFDRERTGDTDRIRMVLQCSELQTNEALHPIVNYIEYAAQIAAEDPFEARLDKLEAFFGPHFENLETAVPLVARMMSIPLGDRYPDPAPTPREFRQKLFDFLCGWIRRQAGRRPILIALEDIHWSDATTRQLIEVLARAVRQLPVLIVITGRPPMPELVGPEIDKARLDIKPLDDAAAGRLVRELGNDLDLTNALVQQIVSQTDGNPLFIEATVRFLGERRGADGAANTAQGGLPSTLLEILQARLDQFGGDKSLAQFASVLGRRFSGELLEATWPFDRAGLDSGIERLLHDGVLETRQAADSTEYQFAHALLREAAYQSLLKQDRARFHRLVADCLETRFAGIAEREPHILAHHHAEAGNAAAAARFLVRAANQALTRSGYVEAGNHLRDGLALLPQIDNAGERAALEIELRIPYGAALVAVLGYATTDVEDNYRQLLARARETGSDLGQFHALLGLSRAAIVSADMARATEFNDDFLDVARRLDQPELLLTAQLLCGIAQMLCADYAGADGNLEAAIAAYDPERHSGLAHRLGQDPGITALFWSAQSRWLQGDSERADTLRAHALELARKLDHPFTLTYMLVRIAGLDRLRGDIAAMRTLAGEAHALAERHGFPAFAAGARFWLADARASEGGDGDVLRAMADEIAGHEPTDQRTNVTQLFVCLTERAIAHGDLRMAADVLRRAVAEIESTGVRWCEPELHRVEGMLRIAEGDPAGARPCLDRAVDLASEHGSHALRLRVLLDRAGLPDAAADTGLVEALETACAFYPAGTKDDAYVRAQALLARLQR